MDNYTKALKILDDVLKEPYVNRDKLVIAKYLLEESLNKVQNNNETNKVKHIIAQIDTLLNKF
jgi:hypothetical protein